MLSPKSKVAMPINRSNSDSSRSSSGSTPTYKSVSTISNELRIGRQGSHSNSNSNCNYVTASSSLSDARVNRSLSHDSSSSARRLLFNDCNAPSPTSNPPANSEQMNLRKMSNEQIIDLMEREQDGLVLKLMKEIDMLKEENKNLKALAGQSWSFSSPQTAGVSSRRTSSISSAEGNKEDVRLPASVRTNFKFATEHEDATACDRKKIKRKPSYDIHRKSTTEYNLIERNHLLQEEVNSLRTLLKK